MIPDEVVETAANELYDRQGYATSLADAPQYRKSRYRMLARKSLQKAAPSIQAAALESAADAIDEDPYDDLDPFYAGWLRDRARKIREGE